MKKLISTFLFFLAVFALSAQDLIYTVSAEIEQQKTSLDSILVENLSNDTRILFGDLPALEYYQINLTKNAFWGTVGASDTEMKPEFVETQNLPGLIQLTWRGIFPVEARLSIFNINGQLVYAAERKTLFPNNSIRVQLTATGVYFVQIQSPLGIKTFKAIGSEKQTDYGVEITEETSAGKKFKSSFIVANSNFSFMDGDSIRISVYKEEYYAPPSSHKINTSRSVDFEFRVSSVIETGVSDAYVELDENTTNVAVYDTLSGEVNIEYTGDKPGLKPGDIITVDADTAGYLRKVVETIDEEGVITVETEQAYFDEVFVDKEIKLHTSLMNPGVQLKSTSTPREISKALTDEDGYIHPVEVFYHGENGQTITKSAITGVGIEEEDEPIIDFYRDLAMDLYGKAGDDIRFYIDEGHVALTSDVVVEFDLKDKGELDENTKVKKGDLRYFKFYLDSEARFLTRLALEMNKSTEKEKTKKLIDLKKATAKFFVGPVPVWITFDVDIYSKYQFNSDAALNADWGFESNHTLQIGGNYDKENDSFIPIKEYTPENTVFPLNVEGEINAFARMEVYPRAEIMFYSFFGPFAEIVPYLQGSYNSAFHSWETNTEPVNFLAWNSGIDLGLDFRVGTKLSFLWGLANKEFGPTVINCFETPLWQSPVNFELLTELPEQVEGGSTTPLKFKVTDFWELPVPTCPVFIEGDGTFSKQILMTNANGEIEVDWLLPETAGTAEFMATIYRANGSVIKQINRWVQISGLAPSVTTIAATDITQTTATLNGNVTSDGGAEITARGFYWSTTNEEPGENDNVEIVEEGLGEFSAILTDLQPNTSYYFVAFATNAEGTSTGSVLSFKTSEEGGGFDGETGTFTDSRDGNIYKWVKIGEQVWMAENLAYLPFVSPSSKDSYTNPYYYVYGYQSTDVAAAKATSNYKTYGVLYNWPAALTACPSGWHLPSDSEWTQLENYLIANGYNYDGTTTGNKIAKSLVATTLWNSSTDTGAVGNNLSANNSSGFSGLPGGFLRDYGLFLGICGYGLWWSSTERSATDAWLRILQNYFRDIHRGHRPKYWGFSVRCVRD